MAKPECKRLHTDLPANVLPVMERAYMRARRWATAHRVRGGRPLSDVDVANIVDAAVAKLCESADAAIATKRAGKV